MPASRERKKRAARAATQDLDAGPPAATALAVHRGATVAMAAVVVVAAADGFLEAVLIATDATP